MLPYALVFAVFDARSRRGAREHGLELRAAWRRWAGGPSEEEPSLLKLQGKSNARFGHERQ
jgi:hypothetical protein